jgi:hypothetical protein
VRNHSDCYGKNVRGFYRCFLRHTRRLAFLPLGSGGSLTARRIASANLVGCESWIGLAPGIRGIAYTPRQASAQALVCALLN